MAKMYNLSSKSSMKKFTKDLEKAAYNSVTSQALQMTVDEKCPSCNNQIKVNNGHNICPCCGEEINVKFDIDFI